MKDVNLTRQDQVRQALEAAIAREQLYLCYQAQTRLADHKLIGLEALCRLRDGQLGDIPADEFIPLAENTGLIVPLEKLVLTQVKRDLPLLLAQHPGIRISVNLSTRHITAPGFFPFIQAWLDSLSPLAVPQLDFEITETCFQLFNDNDIEGLQQLRRRGPRIAMDDFGSGQSSLSRLHTLPFDTIKLDKQFAQQISHPMVYAIIKAAVDFTRQFNIGLIVEGVETQQQCASLADLGCNTVQGYYFGQPERLAHWLNSNNT
mgnify:FL=1